MPTDVDGVTAPAATAQPSSAGVPPGSADYHNWRNFMTDDIKADPVVSGWAE